MKGEKKGKATEEIKSEEKGTELTEEELSKVSGGKEQIFAGAEDNMSNVTFTTSLYGDTSSK